jgi:hypothetical protein
VSTKIVALLASASLATSGVYAVSATRAADVLPGAPASFTAEGDAGGPQCRVDVIRSEPAGVAKVTRSVLADGQCLCTVKTGPQNNNGSAESIVNELLSRRSCDGAPPAGELPEGANAGGGGSGGMIGGLVGALAVGGLAAGLGGKSKG